MTLVGVENTNETILDFTEFGSINFPGYAVTEGLASKVVRAFAREADAAYRQACECGVSDPVLVYVGQEALPTNAA